MSNEPKKETTLRRSFAMQKPVKVIGAGNDAVNVQPPSKMDMYAVEGGYSGIASGLNEAVKVGEQISRLDANIKVAARSRSNSYS